VLAVTAIRQRLLANLDLRGRDVLEALVGVLSTTLQLKTLACLVLTRLGGLVVRLSGGVALLGGRKARLERVEVGVGAGLLDRIARGLKARVSLDQLLAEPDQRHIHGHFFL
jgi:hypothetical protein